MIFTVLTPLVVGIFDQDIPRKVALRFPGLYRQGPRNEYFRWLSRFGWFLSGMAGSGLVFSGVMLADYLRSDRPTGRVVDLWANGEVMFTTVIITVHLYMATVLDHWTWLHHLAIWGSIVLWIVFILAYGNFGPNAIFNENIRWTFESMVVNRVHAWLVFLLVPALAILPDFLWRQTMKMVRPADHQIVQVRPGLDALHLSGCMPTLVHAHTLN